MSNADEAPIAADSDGVWDQPPDCLRGDPDQMGSKMEISPQAQALNRIAAEDDGDFFLPSGIKRSGNTNLPKRLFIYIRSLLNNSRTRETPSAGPDSEPTLDQLTSDLISAKQQLAAAQKRLQEAEILRQAISVIAETLSPDETVELILDQLINVVPYDRACVQILKDGYLEIVGGRGWEDPQSIIGFRFQVPGDDPNTLVIQERRSYILNEGSTIFSEFEASSRGKVQSWLGVPLMARGNVIGMLVVIRDQPGFYQPEHLESASAFAAQATIYLENSKLFAAEQRRTLELEALRATAADITAKLDLRTLLQAVVERAMSLLGATGGELGLVDPAGDRLHIVVSKNIGGEYTGEWIRVGEGVMGFVAQTREPFVVDDYPSWEGRSHKYQFAHLHAALAAPLIIGGRLLGVIGVGTSDPEIRYQPSDLTMLNLFAQQAAIAVDNARLFEKIQFQAITDVLTNLYNRRGLFDLGEAERQSSMQSGKPIAVILIDIDHFKRVNDRYNHAIGDQVLRMIGGVIKEGVRKTDVCARYGGEEFVIVLPGACLKDAARIAEKLRTQVANTPVLVEQRKISVTVSCGVISIQGETLPALANLIDQADNALYAAKQAGRNRTVANAAQMDHSPHSWIPPDENSNYVINPMAVIDRGDKIFP